MDRKTLDDTSKFLSYVLRHQPEAIGLTLDGQGWADIDALIAGAARDGRALD
ncbi:RNA--NAD 2'-phosphotransferase, partial [Pseudomonas aeruginosa]|nr:RNA--NAD 2'-phosphotransferase [Pseudomonas aeruginosa]